jgi:hypothetical protein
MLADRAGTEPRHPSLTDGFEHEVAVAPQLPLLHEMVDAPEALVAAAVTKRQESGCGGRAGANDAPGNERLAPGVG